ncbi:MAG: hypothetical protein HY055_11090 [Magnetospirillum sp.]|nr:hypothetical protein [Magnetospirillum sp.]
MLAAALCLAAPASLKAAEDFPHGLRVIGSTVYALDARGHNVGTLKEVAPGQWVLRDLKGNQVRTIEVPPGAAPFAPRAEIRPPPRKSNVSD